MVVTSDKSNFDVQFEYGDLAQQRLLEVFGSDASTLEIKSERPHGWSKSGNICIEYAYDRWNAEAKERIQSKSGISTSKSEHWAQMLMLEDGSYGAMLVFPTEFLREVMRKLWDTAKKVEVARDERGKAYCILLPITDVMVELQKKGGYYTDQTRRSFNGNGNQSERIPDEIIPFDPTSSEPPV